MNQMGQGEGTLSRAATMVAEARQDFDTLSRQLDGQIQGLGGRWAGAGGSAFFRLHAAWTEKQGRVVAALDRFEQSLLDTERVNVRTDEDQQATYDRYAGRLG